MKKRKNEVGNEGNGREEGRKKEGRRREEGGKEKGRMRKRKKEGRN